MYRILGAFSNWPSGRVDKFVATYLGVEVVRVIRLTSRTYSWVVATVMRGGGTFGP